MAQLRLEFFKAGLLPNGAGLHRQIVSFLEGTRVLDLEGLAVEGVSGGRGQVAQDVGGQETTKRGVATHGCIT